MQTNSGSSHISGFHFAYFHLLASVNLRWRVWNMTHSPDYLTSISTTKWLFIYKSMSWYGDACHLEMTMALYQIPAQFSQLLPSSWTLTQSYRALLTQVPPSRACSIRATFGPNSAARLAQAIPPDPPPITRKSNFFGTGGILLKNREIIMGNPEGIS